MKDNIKIDIHHLTRIEGHGNIDIQIEDGKLKQARWQVVETPRYFEIMLKGKHFSTSAMLTSRICGICSISHCLASLEATEDAFGIKVPELAQKLRLLAKHGETLQSHCLHLLFLAAPDFLQVQSVLPLMEERKEVVQAAAKLKGLYNRLCDEVAGRTTHPITFQPGGVTRTPGTDKLSGLRDELHESIQDLDWIAEIFQTFEIPDFVRETEFVSLQAEADYPFIGRKMVSTDGVIKEACDYLEMTNEYVDADNTSKLCKLSRESMAVGALARFNNNHIKLHPQALRIAQKFGLSAVCHNPFFNNIAQLVECVLCTYESIRIIDEIISMANRQAMVEVQPRAGKGIGVVEAPRGILYHEYEYDEAGRVMSANCIIPTTQNNANIHNDLKSLVTQFHQRGADRARLEQLASMLVRSYDPCVSCSVH